MSSAEIISHYRNLAPIIEPIFVSYYESENGNAPTLYELKQYLVSHTAEKLIKILKESNSSIFVSMSGKDVLVITNLYIRKLRVW